MLPVIVERCDARNRKVLCHGKRERLGWHQREGHRAQIVLDVSEERLAHRLPEADAARNNSPSHLPHRSGTQQNPNLCHLPSTVGTHGDCLDVKHRQTTSRLFKFKLAQPTGVPVWSGRIRVTESAETFVFGLRIGIRCADRHVSFLPAVSAYQHQTYVGDTWQDDGVSENLTIDDTATRWSSPERGQLPLLVLLHGYGADEHDLFGLVPYLPEGIAVASVAAPLAPPWPMPGRSWYPIEGLDGRSPQAVTRAAEAFLRWLDAVVGDAPSIALLGFSQGAAVSLQALRLAPERFGAVVALSGYAAPGTLPGDEVLEELRPPVFWGRGTHDDVIPAELVAHTAQWLPSHCNLSGRVYTGLTHSISEEELSDVHRFLSNWLDNITAA